MILNLILIFPLAHAGLALATSLTSALNAGLLFYLLYKRRIYTPQKGWHKYALQLGFANATMAIMLWFSSAKTSQWVIWSSQQRVLHLLPILLGAVIIYGICLYISGLRWHDFMRRFSD